MKATTMARSIIHDGQHRPVAVDAKHATGVAPASANAPVQGARLAQLDALRGLAAVVVVAHHALLALWGSDAPAAAWSAFNIVLLGRPAVILFYVLSGFVLTLHLKGAREGFAAFAVRRLVRLLVPYAAVIALAFTAFTLVPRHRSTGLSAWFEPFWAADLGPLDLIRHLALLAGARQFPLDPVAWSLVHELRLSLALPMVVIGLRRFGPVAVLAAAGTVTISAEVALAAFPSLVPDGVYGLRFDARNPAISLALTARFSLAFALGAVLAAHGHLLCATMHRARFGLFGLLIGWALLSARNEVAMAFGATVVIAASAWSPFAIVLRARPLGWLGRISYSLYLVHMPVMLACVHAVRGHGPAWAGLLAGLAACVPVAAAMARFVEEPSIRWSRAAARMMSRLARRHVAGCPGAAAAQHAVAAQKPGPDFVSSPVIEAAGPSP